MMLTERYNSNKVGNYFLSCNTENLFELHSLILSVLNKIMYFSAKKEKLHLHGIITKSHVQA